MKYKQHEIDPVLDAFVQREISFFQAFQGTRTEVEDLSTVEPSFGSQKGFTYLDGLVYIESLVLDSAQVCHLHIETTEYFGPLETLEKELFYYACVSGLAEHLPGASEQDVTRLDGAACRLYAWGADPS